MTDAPATDQAMPTSKAKPDYLDLEPDSKAYLRAKRLMANWIAARVTKAARVSARFS
jgi:hypothetical protein